jgi:hypothetical protein
LYYKDDVLLENPTLNGFQLVSTAPDSPKNTPVIKYLTDSPIFVLYNPFYGLHGASMPKNTMVKLDNVSFPSISLYIK